MCSWKDKYISVVCLLKMEMHNYLVILLYYSLILPLGSHRVKALRCDLYNSSENNCNVNFKCMTWPCRPLIWIMQIVSISHVEACQLNGSKHYLIWMCFISLILWVMLALNSNFIGFLLFLRHLISLGKWQVSGVGGCKTKLYSPPLCPKAVHSFIKTLLVLISLGMKFHSYALWPS